MAVISYSCPHCNGPINFEQTHTITICPYCGAQVHFDNQDNSIESAHSQRRRRNARYPVSILLPQVIDPNEAQTYAALWMLDKPYLNLNLARTLQWDPHPSVYVAPIYNEKVSYVANYSIEVGEERERTKYVNGSPQKERYTHWNLQTGQINGTTTEKLWGCKVSADEQLYKDGRTFFQIEGELIDTMPDSMASAKYFDDGEPFDTVVNTVAESNAITQVRQLFTSYPTQSLTVTTPTVQIEKVSLVRVPIWRFSTHTSDQFEYPVYLSAVHPDDGEGNYPYDTNEEKRIKKNYWWIELILCTLLLLLSFSAIRDSISFSQYKYLLLAAGAEIVLMIYNLVSSANRVKQHLSSYDEIADKCWEELRQISIPFESRWQKSIDIVENERYGNKASKKWRIYIINLLAIAICIIGFFLFLPSNKSVQSTLPNEATITQYPSNTSTVHPSEYNHESDIDAHLSVESNDYVSSSTYSGYELQFYKNYKGRFNVILIIFPDGQHSYLLNEDSSWANPEGNNWYYDAEGVVVPNGNPDELIRTADPGFHP